MNNQHPVDELAQIRAQIKALQERENALRSEVSLLIGDGSAYDGDDFTAIQTLASRKGGIDEQAMRTAGINPDKFRKSDIAVVTIRTVVRAKAAA
jgi:hypothetical protein